jgi:signal transduction histidine kinase
VLAATITYAIATVVVVGVFTATTVVGGLLVGRGSAVTAAVATAICAVALAPLRRHVQALVDKRFYPPRRAALTAIERLQDRIHAGAAQPEELEETLRAALKEPSLRVGLRLPGTGRVVDASGAPFVQSRERQVPVVLGAEQVGVLACDSEAGVAVLRAIAPATAVLVEVMRLRAELAAALRDVHESRARLVHAGNLERHRLERDLHDGAQQRLVSLGMAMRIAQMQLGGGAVDVNGVLERAVAELGTAIAELRQIAHGLRPASLDDGLHAALSGLTRTLPMPVHLDVATDGLPDDLATTAYYVACEALTNAAKHAGAERVAVRVSHASDVLRIRVEDDGQGGAVLREGSGLAGLVDRVSALGGSMTMSSPRGSGTVIEAELPCAS